MDKNLQQKHRDYIESLLDSGNPWIQKLLDTTSVTADILYLYQCLRNPNITNMKNFKRAIDIQNNNAAILKMKEIVSNLNLIIENAPKSDRDIIVYRGTTRKNPRRDATMLSTSIEKSVADGFKSAAEKRGRPGYIHEITIPAGFPMLYVESHTENKNEFEIILPFGSVFSDIVESAIDGELIIEKTMIDALIVDQIISDDVIGHLLSKVDMHRARIRGVIQKKRKEWMYKKYGRSKTNGHYENEEMKQMLKYDDRTQKRSKSKNTNRSQSKTSKKSKKSNSRAAENK